MNKSKLTTGGWVRLSLYVVTVLAGLVSYVAGQLGYDQAHEVAASLGQALMILSGGTAASNIGKAPDQGWGGLLRQIRAGVRVIEEQVTPDESITVGVEALPTYDGPTTAQE